MAQKRKKILFVDDDVKLLELLQGLMSQYAGESWDILTALDASQALVILQQQSIDLLVTDVHMPVVDGAQFLSLLNRKYPNVLKVVLTSDMSESCRASCLSNGVELFLEKPRDQDGWKSIYAALDQVAQLQPDEGFRGVLRRVGLQDVLQMECLARSSVVLSVRAGDVCGKVFVKGGEIIHAEWGEKTGLPAFNDVMGLLGGEFDLQQFVEPPERTIEGQWEFLLMEAARKRDEAAGSSQGTSETEFRRVNASALVRDNQGSPSTVPAFDLNAALTSEVFTRAERAPQAPQTTVEELLICSAQGEVLLDWQCPDPNARGAFLELLPQKARQLAHGLPTGAFDRLEVNSASIRSVARIQSDWSFFVRLKRMSAVDVDT
jgi:CheY-like chemotaxis protein